jgi:hypothetical protein
MCVVGHIVLLARSIFIFLASSEFQIDRMSVDGSSLASATLRLGSRFGRYRVRVDDKRAVAVLRRHHGKLSAKKDLDAFGYPATRRRALMQHLGIKSWANGRAASFHQAPNVPIRNWIGKRSRSTSVSISVEAVAAFRKLQEKGIYVVRSDGTVSEATISNGTVIVWVSAYVREQHRNTRPELIDCTLKLLSANVSNALEPRLVQTVIHFHSLDQLLTHASNCDFFSECHDQCVVIGNGQLGKCHSLALAHQMFVGFDVCFLDQDIKTFMAGTQANDKWTVEAIPFGEVLAQLTASSTAGWLHWADDIHAFANVQNNPTTKRDGFRRRNEFPLFGIGSCIYVPDLPSLDLTGNWFNKIHRKEDLLQNVWYHYHSGGSTRFNHLFTRKSKGQTDAMTSGTGRSHGSNLTAKDILCTRFGAWVYDPKKGGKRSDDVRLRRGKMVHTKEEFEARLAQE